MIKKFQNFLKQEHTPLEKGLLILVGLLSGIIIGFLTAPIKKGLKMWSDNGNGNGCNNSDNHPLPSSKLEKDEKHNSKLLQCDNKKATS